MVKLTKNVNRLISGIVLAVMGLLQLVQQAGFPLWLVVLVLGINFILEAQAR